MSLVPLRVVRALLGVVLADAQPALRSPCARYHDEALVDPVAIPLLGLGGRHEELHLHLLELADAEEEVAGRDLVPERLSGLRDAERRLAARDLEDVLEVDEDALRGLRPQERARAGLLDGADGGLEHQVELTRLGQVAVRRLSRPFRGLAAALRVLELVGAEAQLAGAAVDERVGEALDVARRLPDARVEDDRRVERDDVVPLLHHRAQPALADVVLRRARRSGRSRRSSRARRRSPTTGRRSRAGGRARRSCPSSRGRSAVARTRRHVIRAESER